MQRRTLLALGALTLAPLTSATAQEVTFDHLQTIDLAGDAEIVAYDAGSKRLFVTDAAFDALNVFQTGSTPGALLLPLAPIALGGNPNSVAVSDGLVAVAVEGATAQDLGFVEFYNANGSPSGSPVQVGALPDMVTFTPDGTKVLVANEGEADTATGLVNPEGSVTIIDVATRIATPVSFAGFNANKAALQAAGVRLTDVNGITLAQDVEPEYVAISPDGATAYVVLQEANSIAIVDIASGTVSEIRPLGEKDHSLPQNQFDPSNADGVDGNFTTANILGLYMPDAITTFEVDGVVYYATANEGDGRDDFAGFEDETRGADLAADFDLDVEDATPETSLFSLSDLNDDAILGRLKFVTSDYDLARGDTDGDGDVDQLYSFGARSVTIWRADTGAQVFDSGDEFEQVMLSAGLFEDGRSDDKGPEPEAVTFGVVNGRPLLFVGLERTSAILAYDVTDPANATLLGLLDLVADGSESPEGVAFIDASESSTGTPQLAVASEGSGTIALYEVRLSDVGTAFCFGDGSGTACPCANAGAAGEGCANSTQRGAVLFANGNAELSDDTLVLTAGQCPTPAMGMFFSGGLQTNGGLGDATLGNGLRCVEMGVRRLEMASTAAGSAVSTVALGSAEALSAGQTRFYQFWYRDNAEDGCVTNFNGSNAVSVTWQP